VDVVRAHGGVLSLDDLAQHANTYDDPVSVQYRGYDVWEMPPNGQGIVALEALQILSGFDVAELGHNTGPYLHTLIESLRLAFADGKRLVTLRLVRSNLMLFDS
jgi:gamma-glutamyltranspeptidase/glutathione hydrolase